MSFYPLEYISVLNRKKQIFGVAFCLVFIISILFALNWSKYEAFATVEVTPAEISADVFQSDGSPMMAAEAMADLQISRLKQKVLSTSSLAEIITKLNLYPDQRKSIPIAYIAENMRSEINIKLLSTSLANPASAQKASALQLSAIAFVLTFKYENPVLAQKTVNELVSAFLEADLKERRNTAQKTTEFLDGQIKILTENLEEQEEKIAEFRAKNGDIRPDALAFNQQAAASTTSRLLSLESEIIASLGAIGALKSQLAQTDPYARVLDEQGESLTTPTIQLRALKSQYASLRAKYGPKHPDVIKISRQMNALQSSAKPKNMGARIKAEMEDVSAKLKVAQEKYGTEHPDVLSLKKKYEALSGQLENIKSSDSSGTWIIDDADNPAYLQIVAQLEAAQEQKIALDKQKEEVKKQEEDYRKAIAQNPAVEQEMASMVRDYDNLMALYRELKAKKLSSEMNETIEKGSIGQRLSMIEAPQIPLSTSPSRKMIIAVGFVFAIFSAFGATLSLQILNQNIIGPKHLESLIGVTPLVVIPNIKTIDESIKKRKFILKILTFVPVILFIVICIFFLILMPFDSFWASLKQMFK